MHIFRSTLLAAAILGSATAAFATPVTIDFDGVPTGQVALTTYTEHGFTVTNSSHWYTSTNGGNPQPNIASGEGIGGTSAYNSASFYITGTSLFDLTSFDLRAYTNPVTYTITGYDGSAVAFTYTSTDSTVGFSTITLPALDRDHTITKVTFAVSISPSATGTNARFGVDNIDLNTVAYSPEPSSVALLATGMMGMMGLMFLVGRRRIFNS